MEKATKSQAVNGTDHTTIMTPLRVKEAIQANGGGGGTTNHAGLSNLGYAASGHTGFQPTLVSGQNIKTINQTSILGSGNINISGGTQNHAELSNLDYNNAGHTGFQPTLISGQNIKTINGTTILGAGDISVGDGSTYYYDGSQSQEMVAMLNEICGRVDNGESFKLIGHFPYTLSDSTTIIIEAPMVVQKYPSSASEYEPETTFTFCTNPIAWFDWVRLKEKSTSFLLMLDGTWGAFTAINGISTFMDNVIYDTDIANWNGKSTVSVNRKTTSGTNIADIIIDGITTQLYAPTSGGGSVDIDNNTITKNQNDEIQTVGVIDNKTNNSDKFWTGTLAEYNAIGAKDNDTFYNITDDFEELGDKEDVSNKVTTLSSSSTDIEYPSAKAVYDKFIDEMYYKPGDVIDIGVASGSNYVLFTGYVTAGTTNLNICIQTPKRLDNISSITVNNFNVEARGINGYLNNESGYHEFVGRSGYTVTAYKNAPNIILVNVVKSSAWTNISNNSLIEVNGRFKITLN